ncbi:hypothetical protein ACTMTI_48995 [Nonomuraea sp. H19]|uniref:hypothetical protein n=1 Tax=Nonomuraea sp. H19 TaxID=3452206 RepID=UPI003F8CE505
MIAENEPEEQEKAIKFNTLVADLVMYQTTLDMSLVLNQPARPSCPRRCGLTSSSMANLPLSHA